MAYLRRTLAFTMAVLVGVPALAGAGAGDYQTIIAQITSSMSAPPADAVAGWAVVPGAVQNASGMTAVILANGGAVVMIDLSQLDAAARMLVEPGRGVTVVGVYRADGVLMARGVATSTP